MPTIRKPFFVKPLNLGTFVCGNAVTGHPVYHLGRHKAIGLTWKSEGNTDLWIRGDFGSAQSIDFFAMVAANATNGTLIRLRLGMSQAEVDGTAPYDSGATWFITPAITRDDGLYHSHLELPSVQSARWWRIDITGHTGDFEASMAVMGQRIEPSHFYNYDFEYGIEDLGGLDINRWGVLDENPGLIFRSIDFTLAWQSEAEWEGSFRPLFESIGKREVVYLAFDPEPTTYRQARTYMGVMRKPPFAKGTRKNRTFAQDVQLLSMI